MKKIYLALMCMAGFTLITACGGKSDKKDGEAANGEQNTEEKGDGIDVTAEVKSMVKFENTLKATYGIGLDDIAPSYECEPFNPDPKGCELFYGDENGSKAVAYFIKADGTDVTQEEFNSYVTKIYDLTKSISQDGKNILGFEIGSSDKTLDEALQEMPIEKCIGKNEYDVDIVWSVWCFRKDDIFYRVDVSKDSHSSGSGYIELTIDKCLQKSLNETTKDLDKAMEQAGY